MIVSFILAYVAKAALVLLLAELESQGGSLLISAVGIEADEEMDHLDWQLSQYF